MSAPASSEQAVTMVRAKPGTVGSHFIGGPVPEDHRCRPACYRTGTGKARNWIYLLCDYGHSAGGRECGPRSGYAGSAFAASLNDLPAFAPFVLAREQQATHLTT